jgi:hypothetical protein
MAEKIQSERGLAGGRVILAPASETACRADRGAVGELGKGLQARGEGPVGKTLLPQAALAPLLADTLGRSFAATAAERSCSGPLVQAPQRPLVVQPYRGLDAPPADLLVEQIISKVTALDDPHAQPELDPETMLYTQQAERYACRPVVQPPLYGVGNQVVYRQVRIDLEGIGAALASLAAADGAQVMRLVQLLEQPSTAQSAQTSTAQGDQKAAHCLYSVQLNLRQLGDAGRSTPIKMLVDGLLPANEAGRLLGLPAGSEPPGGDVAAWPYVLSKALLKVLAVLQLSQVEGDNLLTWENVMGLLTGRQVGRVNMATAGALWQARKICLEMAKGMARDVGDAQPAGLPGCVTFRDAADLAHAPVELDGMRLEAALGGLGVRAKLLRGALDLILLPNHAYSIVGFDSPTSPRRVNLYNPLGYNSQSARPGAKLRQADFMVHEDLALRPRAQGTFWMPIETLFALAESVQMVLPASGT